jgi:hypothetical protein
MKIGLLFIPLLLCVGCLLGEVSERLDVSADKADYEGNQMTFSGHVVIDHPLGRLCADKGFVNETGKNKVHGYHLPGFITLSAEGDAGTCQLQSIDGKVITAFSMHVDTAAGKLILDTPKGQMTVSRGKEVMQQHLNFSSGSLVWEEPFHTMKLIDDVVFNQGDMGTLFADREVEIKEHIEGDKRILSKIISRGKTSLVYSGNEKIAHTLTAYGEICVDHENMEVLLTNPENLQVHFKDNFGEFFSDKAKIEYTVVNYHITPTALILDGNVHVRNQFARVETPQNPLVQYAMADHIHYSLLTGDISLSADKGHRVLFYDKLNHMQVSAPVLRMKRDPKTNQDTIKGEGDVRFTFIKQELDALQAYFEKDLIDAPRK